MNYEEISKETFFHIYKAYESLKNSPLDPSLRILIELRVSQINGCSYCCNLHKAKAQGVGIDQNKLEQLPNFRASELFSDKEKAALEWAEVITQLKADSNSMKSILEKHFDERQIVDIATTASLMNAFNRVAINLR